MSETKQKLVNVEFDIKDLMLGEGTTCVFGVPVELNEKGDKFVGKCSAEELKAFKDGGRV